MSIICPKKAEVAILAPYKIDPKKQNKLTSRTETDSQIQRTF